MKKTILLLGIVVAISVISYVIVKKNLFPVQPVDQTKQAEENKLYVNKKFKYTFKYPTTSGIMIDNGIESNIISEAGSITLLSDDNRELFNVEVVEPSAADTVGYVDSVVRIIRLPLQEYVNNTWNTNKTDKNSNIKNKEVGDIVQTSIGGEVAYQFTLTGTFAYERGGYVLDEKNTFIFVDHNGLRYIIWFPENNKVAKQVFDSFEFTNN